MYCLVNLQIEKQPTQKSGVTSHNSRSPLFPIPRIRLIQHAHEGLELQRADVADVRGEIVDLAERRLAHLFRHRHEA